MITAVEYLKSKARMTGKCTISCYDCYLSGRNRVLLGCRRFEQEHPEKAIEIVEKWAKEHPVKTFLSDFLEKYPNAPCNTFGIPKICPSHVGYAKENAHDCDLKCDKCWNRELEEK